MRREWIIGGLALVAALLVLLIDPEAVAAGWRAGFLTASAPVLGAVLMLMIGRVTGGDWPAFGLMAAASPIVLLFALAILPAQFASDMPAHLRIWASPFLIAVRTAIAVGALVFVAIRVTRGASLTFAAIALAAYAVVISPVAYDWMLGGSLGHPVSAIGMMLTAEQVGGACAALLVLGIGPAALRRDMSYILIAAALGLSYMIFMDYLIKWYADLPSQVDWYVERGGWAALLAAVALVIGLFGPIVSLTISNAEPGRRAAGICALTGLALINLWFVGGGWLAALVAILTMVWMAAWSVAVARHRLRENAHG